MFTRQVTRTEAQRAAEVFAREHGLEVQHPLIDGATLRADTWPVYNPPADFPEDWWVALAIHVPVSYLRSSVVLGVSKWTGAVRELGSAGDEG